MTNNQPTQRRDLPLCAKMGSPIWWSRAGARTAAVVTSTAFLQGGVWCVSVREISTQIVGVVPVAQLEAREVTP